jgi:hypothetical protein
MKASTAERMLHLPVRVGDIELGRAVDLIVDPTDGRTLGLDVLCRDGSQRYLPLAAATAHPDWIEAPRLCCCSTSTSAPSMAARRPRCARSAAAGSSARCWYARPP